MSEVKMKIITIEGMEYFASRGNFEFRIKYTVVPFAKINDAVNFTVDAKY